MVWRDMIAGGKWGDHLGKEPVYRHEDKYLVAYLQYMRVRQMIAAVMQRDSHAENDRGYTVRSLYYDTVSNRDYHEKEDGVDERQKLRLRTYGSAPSIAKLEIKHRKEGGIFKESVTLSMDEVGKIMAHDPDYSVLESKPAPAANHILWLLQTKGYTPAAIVAYDREAFTLPFYETRVTFDTSIRGGRETGRFLDPSVLLVPVIPSTEIVMEVKYNHMFPNFLRPLISIAEGQNMAISKYWLVRQQLG